MIYEIQFKFTHLIHISSFKDILNNICFFYNAKTWNPNATDCVEEEDGTYDAVTPTGQEFEISEYVNEESVSDGWA